MRVNPGTYDNPIHPIVVLAVFMTALSLFALDPRGYVLGEGASDNPSDMVQYPSAAGRYGNIVLFNLNSSDSDPDWVLASFQLDSRTTLGFHLGRQDGAFFDVKTVHDSYPINETGTALFVSRTIGTNSGENYYGWNDLDLSLPTTLGFGLYVSSSSLDSSIQRENYPSNSNRTCKCSGVTLSCQTGRLDLALIARTGMDDRKVSTYSSDRKIFDRYNTTEGLIESQYWLSIRDKSRLRFLCGFSGFGTKRYYYLNNPASDTDNKYYTNYWKYGFAAKARLLWQRPLLEKGLLVTGLTFSMYKEERPYLGGSTPETPPVSDEDSRYRIPSINLGMEIPLIDRNIGREERPMLLMLRGGAEKTLEYTESAEQTEYAYVTTKNLTFSSDDDFIALGLGLELAGLFLDFTISDALMENGLFSGEKITSDLAIGYRF